MIANPEPNEANWPTPRQGNYTLAILLTAYTLSYADRMMMSLLIEPIKRSLHITDTQVSLLIGFAFGLFYVIVGLPAGYLADRVKRQKLIVAGLIAWSAMTALCGMAASFGTLFLGRMGVGIGEATLAPSAYSLLSDTFPRHRMGRATSIYAMGVPLGTGAALTFGGLLISALAATPMVTLPLFGTIESWRTIFLILAFIGLPVALLVFTLREPVRRDAHITRAKPNLKDSLRFLISRREVLLLYLPAASVFSCVFAGFMTWVPSFVIRTYHVTASDTGFYFGIILGSCGLVGLLLGGFVSDHLSQRGQPDAHLRTTLYLSLAAFPFMVALPLMPSFHLALLMLIPCSAIMMGTSGIAVAIMQLMTPGMFRGQMTALFLLFATLIGAGIGPTLVALLTDYGFQDPAKLHYSMAITFAIELPLASMLYALSLRPYRAAIAAYQDERIASDGSDRAADLPAPPSVRIRSPS